MYELKWIEIEMNWNKLKLKWIEMNWYGTSHRPIHCKKRRLRHLQMHLKKIRDKEMQNKKDTFVFATEILSWVNVSQSEIERCNFFSQNKMHLKNHTWKRVFNKCILTCLNLMRALYVCIDVSLYYLTLFGI